MTVESCELDFQVGGEWRIVLRHGEEVHPFHGEIREIVPGKRYVQSFTYDVAGAREHPAVETIAFAERGGETVLTNTISHDSQASRDARVGSGMERGAASSMDALETLLADLA